MRDGIRFKLMPLIRYKFSASATEKRWRACNDLGQLSDNQEPAVCLPSSFQKWTKNEVKQWNLCSFLVHRWNIKLHIPPSLGSLRRRYGTEASGAWLVLLQTQPGHFLAGRLWTSESASLSFIFLIYTSEIAIPTSLVVKIIQMFSKGLLLLRLCLAHSPGQAFLRPSLSSIHEPSLCSNWEFIPGWETGSPI